MPLTHRISRSTWYVLAMIYVSLFAAAVGNMIYTNHVAAENSRKWCHLLTTLDDGYGRSPPQTATGQQLAADTHRLLADLHCAGKR